MVEFKSFYKTVEGNEGQKCHYPTRLDTYGCGCAHDCKYCYAKSLLSFRGLWRPLNPSVANIDKVKRKIKTLKKDSVVRLGGMTDCFQPCESIYKVTYETINALNKQQVHYLIVTKSDMVADDKYVAIMDKRLAHIQITVTCTDDGLAATYEHAVSPSRRIAAIEKLERLGFDVQIRISPLIPEYLDWNIINNVKCHKAIVEFLRVNEFIKRTFPELDYSRYTHNEGNYWHLPLSEKKELLKKINGFREISVCEDCTEAYNYWQNNVNFNKQDCCNLRMAKAGQMLPYPRIMGNDQLLQGEKIAYLCSSNPSEKAQEASKKWAMQKAQCGTCLISGFQSATERDVLDVLLENNGKAIIVLANRMLPTCPAKYQKAMKENRLLILSYFDDTQVKVTRSTAEIRNKQVLNIADSIVVGCIKRHGMTEKLVAQSSKPCFVLDGVRME